MNTNATSMDVEAEDGTMAAAYQDYLADSGVGDTPEVQEAYYAGANALLSLADPLSKIGALQQEINDFFDAQ